MRRISKFRNDIGSFWYGNEPIRSSNRCNIGIASEITGFSSEERMVCIKSDKLVSDQSWASVSFVHDHYGPTDIPSTPF